MMISIVSVCVSIVLHVCLINRANATVIINSYKPPQCYHEWTSCDHGLGSKAVQFYSNKQVLFIGDSLTRYQYLSLCYILRHRKAQRKETYPSVLQENTWDGWPAFFIGSSNMLYPYEECTVCDHGGTYEYRHYHDPHLNIKLTYIQYRGIGFEKDNWLSIYFPNNEHLDLVVTNVGFFGFHFSNSYLQFIEVMKALADKVVWKTTTYQDQEYTTPDWWEKHSSAAANRTTMNQMDSFMCNYEGVLCLDTSWTATHAKSSNYWDTTHFKEPIYAIFNDELINILKAP